MTLLGGCCPQRLAVRLPSTADFFFWAMAFQVQTHRLKRGKNPFSYFCYREIMLHRLNRGGDEQEPPDLPWSSPSKTKSIFANYRKPKFKLEVEKKSASQRARWDSLRFQQPGKSHPSVRAAGRPGAPHIPPAQQGQGPPRG